KRTKQLSFTIYEARLKLSQNDPIKIIFDNLDFSFIYDIVKDKYNSKTYQGYDPVSLFKALILIYLGEAHSERDLANKLKFDSRLCALCEFDNFLKTPTHATFSIFRKKLGEKIFFKIFHHLVAQAFTYGIIKGIFTAADATEIWAYANPNHNSDPDATWGHKTEKYVFYGYKVHLMVDTKSQLPIAIEVTPANESDSTHLKDLTDQIKNFHPYMEISTTVLDAGYDSHSNYQLLFQLNINPVIALNQRTGINPLLTGELNVSPDGKIQCSAGCSLVYWGYDLNRNRLKFRCPAKLGRCNCLFIRYCSNSHYGRTFYIHPTDDLRLVGRIPRGTLTWKKLYDLRTSVERTNSELKNSHYLDNLRFRTLPKVKTHVYLSAIAQILKKFEQWYIGRQPKFTFSTS
ncbi:MAG: transposase, partial [Endomicrobiia bacterium]